MPCPVHKPMPNPMHNKERYLNCNGQPRLLALSGTKGSCILYIKVLEFILLQMGVTNPEVFSGTG